MASLVVSPKVQKTTRKDLGLVNQHLAYQNSKLFARGIHLPRGQRGGVVAHEMTMNNPRGGGFPK